jgi:hypothetical protein
MGGGMSEPLITTVPLSQFVPDIESRSPVEASSPRLIHAANQEEPAPLEYWWGGSLFPVELIGQLFGAGDAGKSFLALGLSFAITLGTDLLGMPVRKGRVLWLDAEGMGEENLRRAYRIARGMDLSRPPAGLWFLPVEGSLLDTEHNDACLRAVGESGADFIVLDSFAGASFTIDSNKDGEVVGFVKQLRAMKRTVLVIDHIPKAYAVNAQKAGTASGTIQKHNQSRSSVELTRANGGGYHLSHSKHNTAPEREPITYAMNFSIDSVRFELIDADDPRMEGLQVRPLPDRVLVALAEFGEFGATAKEIADILDVPQKSVSDALSKLKARGQVEAIGGRKWRAL